MCMWILDELGGTERNKKWKIKYGLKIRDVTQRIVLRDVRKHIPIRLSRQSVWVQIVSEGSERNKKKI